MKSSKSNAKSVNKQENKVVKKGKFAAKKTGDNELKEGAGLKKYAKKNGMKMSVVK